MPSATCEDWGGVDWVDLKSLKDTGLEQNAGHHRFDGDGRSKLKANAERPGKINTTC